MSCPKTYGVFYDFRNPVEWREPWDQRYQALLEQIRWVDQGDAFEEVSLSEHHFVSDGYSPSILGLAIAVGALTSRVGVTTNILQLPLHHPLRVAEDALTADVVTGGRFRLGVAAGYRELEFQALGVSVRQRATRMEEGVEILRRAFTGDRFSFEGRHWQIPPVTVTPGTVRDGGPPIWIGGAAAPAIERAARLGDGFLASKNSHVTTFIGAAERLGRSELRSRTARTARLLIAPDPEKAIVELGPHLLHQVNQYVDFGFIQRPHYTDARDVVRAGHYDIVDADGAVARLVEAGNAGVAEFHLMAVLPGESVESGSERLEYVAAKVLPQVRRHEGMT